MKTVYAVKDVESPEVQLVRGLLFKQTDFSAGPDFLRIMQINHFRNEKLVNHDHRIIS